MPSSVDSSCCIWQTRRRHLKSWLPISAAGGIIAFQDTELGLYRTVIHPDTPLINQLVEWGLTVFERSGAHLNMGMELYRVFVDAGLPEPTLHFEAPMGGPEDWPGFEYLANSFRSLIPLMEAYGIATVEDIDIDTLADRIQAEVTDLKTSALVATPHITAYASLPA